MFDKKAYMESYRLEHAEEKRQYHRKYMRKNERIKYVGYGGVCFCPKCGKRGYKKFYRKINIKTGSEYSVFTVVLHYHNENGKTILDGNCHIGMGRL